MVETLVRNALGVNAQNVYSQGGSLFFTATALVKEFAPVEVMEQYAWTGKGKEARYRHETPESNVDALIGHVHDFWVENGELKALAEVWGYKDSLKAIQKSVIAGELAVSLGYKKTTDNDGKIVAIYIRELSLTPNPKCAKCLIDKVILNEKHLKQNIPQTAMVTNEMPDSLEILEKTVIKQNEERGERIVELESVIEAMEQKIGDSNKLLSSQKEQISKLEKEVEDFKSKQADFATLALRQEIIKLEKIADAKASEQELKDLMQFNEVQLKKMRDVLARNEKLAQKVGREPPVLAGAETSAENEGNQETPEELALKLNPQLRDMIKKNEQRSARGPAGYRAGAQDGSVDESKVHFIS